MHTKRGFIKGFTLALLVAAVASGTNAKSCLWKVSSEKGILYVQGSVHVLKAESYPLARAIEQAYTESEVLVLEVDMQEMASPKTQQRILSKAMLPGTETLKQTLDANTYKKLGAACTQAGFPIAALEKSKPWFATISLTLVTLQNMGFNPENGLDTYFYNKAKADQKKVIGLESVDFQIDLFDRLAQSNPNDFVARALTDLDILQVEIVRLEKAWRTGDLDALGALMSKSFEGYPELYKTFVLARNERWLKKLNRLLETSKTHMVVVGAGHLPGKGGLLELLQNKGYKLEQL